MKLTDNTFYKYIEKTDGNWCLEANDQNITDHKSLIALLSSNSLSDLATQGLLIFPNELDNNNSQTVLTVSKSNCSISTNNLVGFVGKDGKIVSISSRFQKNQKDYFLHYMLSNVFYPNILNLQYDINEDNIYDLLFYIFPIQLEQALKQGLYKKYQYQHYNDGHIKGRININAHIKKNYPFQGKVAYDVREYSYDNDLTQLIRHTIEYLQADPIAHQFLTSDANTQTNIMQIVGATPTYKYSDRLKIIKNNLTPINHPYFTQYIPLQKLCLQILNNAGYSYEAHNEQDIYGILFDGAWLWEQYLNTLFSSIFKHPDNQNKSDAQQLFKDDQRSFQKIYPDFLCEEKHIVGDAKYTPLDKKKYNLSNEEKALNIYYKTITYMYRWSSKLGYLFYPYAKNNEQEESTIKKQELNIIDTDGKLIELGFPVPQDITNYQKFIELMQKNEEKYVSIIKELNN